MSQRMKSVYKSSILKILYGETGFNGNIRGGENGELLDKLDNDYRGLEKAIKNKELFNLIPTR